jgi:hypothetical protein
MPVAMGTYDDDQWHYSPDRDLASLTGFMIVFKKDDVGLSAPRYTCSRHPDSAIRDI